MFPSDIGQAFCDAARFWQNSIPTEDCAEGPRHALRGRSGPKNRDDLAPTGIDELGVRVVAPAIINAVAQLTGKGLQQLPMLSEEKWTIARPSQIGRS